MRNFFPVSEDVGFRPLESVVDGAFLEAVVHGVGSPVVVLDGEGRVLTGNRKAASVMGVGVNDLSGRILRRSFSVPVPVLDGRARVGRGRVGDSEGREFWECLFVVGEMGMDGVYLEVAILEAGGSVGSVAGPDRGLLSTIAHEVRGPMASIRGFVEAVAREPEMAASMRADFLGVALGEVDRLGRLVDGLVEWARLQGGGSAALEPQSVGLVVDRVMARLGPDIELAGQSWVVDMAEGLPLIDFEPKQLEVLLFELANNAFRYTPRGGRVRIHAFASGTMMAILVEDSGPGIAPDEREQIFDLCYRGRAGRKAGQGSGIGLSVAVGILRRHQGRIDVISKRDGGSTFVVAVPLKQARA